MSSNQKIIWSKADLTRLKTLYLQKMSYLQIAKAMGRSRASVERTIARERQSGNFPDRPRTSTQSDANTAFSRSTRYHAEIRMLEQVNAIGGFPVRRNITVRGKVLAVWTKLGTNELHPLYRAIAFGAEQAAA